MNLSSYLQMPPAPSVPTSTSIPALPGVPAGASPAAGGGLGIDFGQLMARQMQRLVPQQRQNFAADTPANPETTAREQDNQRADAETQTKEHSKREASPAQNESSRQATPQRARTRPAAHNTDQDSANPQVGESFITPRPVQAPEAAATAQNTANSTRGQTTTPLQTIELSPQVRIITDPKKAPSPESLAAFAKSMGLDESTIQNLLGEAPSTATALSPTLETPSATSLPSMTTAGPSATNPLLMQTPMGTTASKGDTAGMPSLDSLVTTQLAGNPANAGAHATVASGAGLAASASTLNAPTMPGLSPTDMAAIQQIQITVLPAAVLPVHTGANSPVMPSTIDMLSLLGSSGVGEKDVSALLSQFSDSTGGDSQPDSEQSPQDSNNLSSFSQALTRNTPTANSASANAAPTNGANMSEVYDQLSDKMATELAARMHKQLSDGEWKMKFGLRPSNLGGVEIQLEMKDGKLDAVFRADNPLTRDLLQNSSQRLREALGNFGINAGQVQVGQGGGNGQQNSSGRSTKQGQVRDNSTSQVNGTDSASSATSARNKANASLLDLYA